MRKIVSIILLVLFISSFFTGCSLKSGLKEDVNVKSVDDLKKLHDDNYNNLCKDLYDDQDILLSKDDDSYTTMEQSSVIGNHYYESFNYFRGYKTKSFFYRYNENCNNITFTYKSSIVKGRCKLIIISPSLKIVSTIELNGKGVCDVPIDEDGNYYVRVVGDDAEGEIEFNAEGANIIYNFIHEGFDDVDKTGLYDYK